MKSFALPFALLLMVSFSAYSQSWQERFFTTSEAPTNTDWDIFDIDGNIAVVGSPEAKVNFSTGAGEVHIYEIDSCGRWAFLQSIDANDPATRTNFGLSVAISDSTIIVGAQDRESSQYPGGCAYIFQRDGNGVWSQTQKISASDGQTDDHFGAAVDIDGDYAVVTSKYDDHGSGSTYIEKGGSAYVFKRNSAGIWNEEQKLVPPDNVAQDYFGYSVSMEDSTILVGSIYHSLDTAGQNSVSQAGAGYIFSKKANGMWSFDQKLVTNLRTSGDHMGRTVALANGVAVFGLYKHDYGPTSGQWGLNCGTVVVFEMDASGAWHELNKITASDWAAEDQFGSAISFDGERLVVGASSKELDENGANPLNEAGAAYLFRWDSVNSQFIEVKRFFANNRIPGNDFGRCVMINGNEVMIASNTTFDIADVHFYRESVRYEQWDTVRSCGPIVWLDGNTYSNSSDTASILFQQANGCDSLVHLSLYPTTIDTTITASVGSLISNTFGGTYQWIDCTMNQPIPNATNKVYTPTSNGVYAVEIQKNGCIDTSMCYVYEEFSISENNPAITVYPNPAVDLIHLEGDFDPNATWQIIQMDGSLLKSGKCNDGVIYVSSLKSGVYFLSITSESKKAVVRIVKM
ncbi:MAG: T9SS type A sorting domain-containing protein [Flavobacteriia bacterium]|nr:T9SS type A sorting domain-containing protein [Flavobacteriia bacterium]